MSACGKDKILNAKNKKIMLILVAAILAAAASGFALYLYLMPQKTTIYVFRDNYKAGEAVTDAILTPMQVDARIVLAGRTTDTSDRFVTGANRAQYVDKRSNALRMDVAKGMPLTISMLSVDGGSYIEMNMDEKKVAVTVPINSISGVTGDLKAGSRINVYASNYKSDNSTTLIFENMRVLSVSGDDGSISAATLEVTPKESLKLIEAANHSSLYFGLVNGSGYQATGEEDLTFTPDAETYTGDNQSEQLAGGEISSSGHADNDVTEETTDSQTEIAAGGGDEEQTDTADASAPASTSSTGGNAAAAQTGDPNASAAVSSTANQE